MAGNSSEETESVRSASTEEQLSFWSLIFSFMFKLVALGVTIFVLPYNEWITLNYKNSSYKFIVKLLNFLNKIYNYYFCFSVEYLAAIAAIKKKNMIILI